MQDKSYAIAIVVVLGICCLGMYVAVSGYLNSNPSWLPSIISGTSATPVFVAISTDTPGPTQPPSTLQSAPTIVPVPSPLGALQTITAAATIVVPLPPPTVPRPTASPTSASSPGMPSCAGFQFCPKVGPPDFDLGVGGDSCPRNYIWGQVIDANNRGISDVRIRYKLPTGDVADTFSKGPPERIVGKYDIPAQGGTFTIWLLNSTGGAASPQVPVTVQGYSGVGNCPTRLDFVQQR